MIHGLLWLHISLSAWQFMFEYIKINFSLHMQIKVLLVLLDYYFINIIYYILTLFYHSMCRFYDNLMCEWRLYYRLLQIRPSSTMIVTTELRQSIPPLDDGSIDVGIFGYILINVKSYWYSRVEVLKEIWER